MNLERTQTAMGALSRRVASRIGKAKAITATTELAVLPNTRTANPVSTPSTPDRL